MSFIYVIVYSLIIIRICLDVQKTKNSFSSISICEKYIMDPSETTSLLCTKRNTMSQKIRKKSYQFYFPHRIPENYKETSMLLGERAVRFPFIALMSSRQMKHSVHVISQSHVAGHMKVAPPYDPKNS